MPEVDGAGSAPKPFGPRVESVLLALVAGLAVSMWLATISAGLGRFAPVFAVAGGATAAGAGIVMLFLGGDRTSAPDPSKRRPDGTDLLLLVFVALFATRAWPPSIAWPAFLDGGWYAAAAVLIARQGDTALEVGAGADPVFVMRLADQRRAGIGVPPDEDTGFHAVAFAVKDVGAGTASPYHPPFYASWLAIFVSLLGLDRLGLGATIWAIAWAAALGVLARRTFGTAAGPWSIGIAGLSPLVLFFARQPFAELAAGALIMSALAILAAAREGRRGTEPRGAVPGWLADARGPFGAGLLLGLAGLTKLDVLPAVAATVAWWSWSCWRGLGRGRGQERGQGGAGAAASRSRSAALGLWLGLVPAAAHGIAIAAGPSAVYYSLNLWGVRGAFLDGLGSVAERLGGWPGALAVAVAGVAVVAAFALGAARVRRDGARRSGRSRPGPDLRWLLVAVAAYGPALIVTLLWLRDRPGDDAAGPASLSTILVWAITPLGAWAALAGWAQLIRGAGDAGGSGSAARPETGSAALLRPASGWVTASPIAPAALATFVVLAAPLVTRSLSPVYAGRRLLPIAVPLACLLAGAVADRAWRRGGLLRLACGAGVVIAAASLLIAARSISPSRDLAGARLIVQRLEAYGSPEDVFVFPSSLSDDDAGRLAAAVWALDGRTVAVVGSPAPDLERLGAAVSRILDSGRQVFWIGAKGPPALEGIETEVVGQESVITEVLAPDPDLPPRMNRFELSLGIHALEAARP